ncbi:MAG: PQQ-dependent sugar dehydrogenase [Glaciihabitans sp.]|nr:PQQ-dependent sugar dehydrogenase [Glaciihabitans sp.]
MPTRKTNAAQLTARLSASLLAIAVLAGCASEPAGVPGAVPTPLPPTSDPTGSGSTSTNPTGTNPAETPTGSANPEEAASTGPVMPLADPTTITTGLDLPWSMVRVPESSVGGNNSGRASTLVSERDTAQVKEVADDGSTRVVGEVANVVPGGEGGLLGLAVYTGPADDAWLYAYTTTATDNSVVRMPLSGSPGSYTFGAAEVVFDGIPKAGNHNGGRIKFGPDGMLYVTAGDAGNRQSAQDPAALGGKILRMTPTGEVPEDNPDPQSYVYSLGHRNPQGISWDRDGNLWAAEFGQDSWDELNAIVPGGNYGWPVVEGIGNDPAYINPVHQWATSDASPSGLLWTRDTLLLAALRGERLWAIYPNPGAVEATGYFEGQFGRMRDVIEGPNGTVWILTNNTGRAPRDGDDKILEVRLGALDKG